MRRSISVFEDLDPEAPWPISQDRPEEMSRIEQGVTLTLVLLPFLGLIAATIIAWGRGVGWWELALFAVMYAITGHGITIGFHRFFAHRSFETSRACEAVLAIIGSMAVEGPLIRWVAIHRSHHQHSDQPEDPHSPHQHGEGAINQLRGLFQAHMGWLFSSTNDDLPRYVVDFQSDRMIRFISRSFLIWVGLGFFIPAAAGFLITGTWFGALLGLIWGGFVRIFFVHHVTWSVNSVCHIWGSRPFRSHDFSRNNPFFGVLALGEGWHNNHHAFPTSARHGLRWWQFDSSYIIIWTLARLGVIWNVKIPSASRMASKLA